MQAMHGHLHPGIYSFLVIKYRKEVYQDELQAYHTQDQTSHYTIDAVYNDATVRQTITGPHESAENDRS